MCNSLKIITNMTTAHIIVFIEKNLDFYVNHVSIFKYMAPPLLIANPVNK